MKKNKITLIIALVLLIVAVVLTLNNSRSSLNKKESAFAVEDTASVTRIFLADRNDQQVLLERMDDGTWTLDGEFRAHDAKVESLLKTLREIRVKAPVPLTARNGVISRMATMGKKVEIYQVAPAFELFGRFGFFEKERITRTYYVGDVTQDNMGTFMLMEGSDNPYIIYLPGLRGFVASRYSTIADQWREHTVFRTPISEIAEVEVTYPLDPGNSFKVVNNDDRTHSLVDPATNMEIEGYDTARMLSFLTSFRDIRFEAFLNDEDDEQFVDSVLSTTPVTIINLKRTDGIEKSVKIFYKGSIAPYYDEDGYAMEPIDLDRAYASINEGKDFVLIQYFVFDRILRKKEFFTGNP